MLTFDVLAGNKHWNKLGIDAATRRQYRSYLILTHPSEVPAQNKFLRGNVSCAGGGGF